MLDAGARPIEKGGLHLAISIFRITCLVGLFAACAACAFPVEGEFLSRRLNERQSNRAILIIFNHGYSREKATTFKASFPPILRMAEAQNDDVMSYAQVRNTISLERADHASFIESAVEFFHTQHKIPVENIILAGQSCGGWGSLQAAAFAYPRIGGVVAFAPTCHGQLIRQSAEIKIRRYQEIGQLTQRLRSPALIFLYEGDSYYELEDWRSFEVTAGQFPQIRVVKLDKRTVLKTCPSCVHDSHGAASRREFADAYFHTLLQPFIESVRASMRERERSKD
ncbi:MAG: hypothetical protein AAB285_05535 [candidate division NC10 bacterium]